VQLKVGAVLNRLGLEQGCELLRRRGGIWRPSLEFERTRVRELVGARAGAHALARAPVEHQSRVPWRVPAGAAEQHQNLLRGARRRDDAGHARHKPRVDGLKPHHGGGADMAE